MSVKLDWAQWLRAQRELDIGRIGGWPAWLRISMAAALLASVLIAGYGLVLAPSAQALRELRTDALALRQTQAGKLAAAAPLEAIKQQQQTLQGILAARLQQLPADAETPALLEAINRAAQDNGVNILGISFQPAPEPDGEAPQAVDEVGFYAELPMQLSLSGGYHQFGAFVSRLAGWPRLITVHDFEIRRPGSGPALTMHLTAKIYRHLEEPQ